MELVWASKVFRIAGQEYAGFPIVLWDSMESCIPANEFLRRYLLRGAIGSKKSWPNTGRALYDYFSFLQAHELAWQGVDRGESKNLLAAYRDYCRNVCELNPSTVRQRLGYICKFYEFSLEQAWISQLPFAYEDRLDRRDTRFLAHLDRSGGRTFAKEVMPKAPRQLPKYLTSSQIAVLLEAAENPHHRMMMRLGLQTGLRREEIATFPLAYVVDPDVVDGPGRNMRINLDPYDGYGILTKGKTPRTIVVSRRFMAEMHRYAVQMRGERASLSDTKHQSLFLNKFGEPYAGDGKAFERIVRNLGIRSGIKAYPHILRHTYATHTLVALQRNREDLDPLVFLQRQLGHASINTTLVYLHLINEMADAAVLAYDDELNELCEDL